MSKSKSKALVRVDTGTAKEVVSFSYKEIGDLLKEKGLIEDYFESEYLEDEENFTCLSYFYYRGATKQEMEERKAKEAELFRLAKELNFIVQVYD